jgi:hypothetical protein
MEPGIVFKKEPLDCSGLFITNELRKFIVKDVSNIVMEYHVFNIPIIDYKDKFGKTTGYYHVLLNDINSKIELINTCLDLNYYSDPFDKNILNSVIEVTLEIIKIIEAIDYKNEHNNICSLNSYLRRGRFLYILNTLVKMRHAAFGRIDPICIINSTKLNYTDSLVGYYTKATCDWIALMPVFVQYWKDTYQTKPINYICDNIEDKYMEARRQIKNDEDNGVFKPFEYYFYFLDI